jgi:Brp/Blh family beta-carotene 15,15'-monooxygenase
MAFITDERPLLTGALLLFSIAMAGVPLGGETATGLLCLGLLLVGLPHGALDIERLKLARDAGRRSVAGLFALYLALALGTFLVWQASPVGAMGLFLLTATIHFSEDWETLPDPLLALGTAAALLSAPALFHLEELSAIFATVTGSADAALLAELMRAVAPVAFGLALAGMAAMVRSGEERAALTTVLLLSAMLLLPPVAGFFLFFCLFHSPRHLGEAWRSLSLSRERRLAIGIALTLAALGLAAALTGLEARGGLTASLVAATFMTFSILTVPHMLAPHVVALLGSAAGRTARG